MKIYIPILLVVCSLSASCQKKMHTIRLQAIYPYCGGARPTPEMQEAAQKPQPYANKTVLIVSQKNKIDSATTNENGELKVKLAPGKYKLYEPWNYYKKAPGGDPDFTRYDTACLKKTWRKPVMEITVTKTKLNQKSADYIPVPCEWNMPCLFEKYKISTRPE